MKKVRGLMALVAGVAIIGVAFALGCNTETVEPEAQDTGMNNEITTAQLVATPAYPQRDTDGFYELPDVEYIDRDSELMQALNTFSTKTFTQVYDNNTQNAGLDNTCYSPLSLFYALSMVAQGADGETRDELFHALGIADSDDILEQYRSLYLTLYTQDAADVKLANALWLSTNDYGFKDSYLALMEEKLYAEIYGVTFGTPEADIAMSQWAAERTDGLIAPAIQSEENWAMALMNTLYFKAAWSKNFDPSLSYTGDFDCLDGSVARARYMVQDVEESGDVTRTDKFTATSLYFSNGTQLRMVLPADGVTVSDIVHDEKVLNQALYGDPTMQASVTFTIPQVDFDASYDLIDTACALGVTKAFGSQADFSRMMDVASYVSSISQDTHFTVNEEGVLGAAYTVVEIMAMSLLEPEVPEDHIDFILDKPFLYAVITPEGAPLFVGTISNPQM